MPEIQLTENDRLEWALKSFKRKMEKAGIFRELRRRRHYVKPSAARQLKRKAAQRAKFKAAQRARNKASRARAT